MSSKKKPGAPARRPVAGKKAAKAAPALQGQVDDALRSLKKYASAKIRDEMAPRYGIVTDNALGVPMARIKLLAKSIGRNHDLALALWNTGVYEARLLASFVAEPARVTPAQMDRWRKDFDNWGVCDTVCFALWDRVPHAFDKVDEWSTLKDEFGKRAAFALLACIALHDKSATDEPFIRRLPLLRQAATDERNFVKKAVSWAMRAIGRRSVGLRAAMADLCEQFAASESVTARWIGRDVDRDLARLPGR